MLMLIMTSQLLKLYLKDDDFSMKSKSFEIVPQRLHVRSYHF